MRCRISPTTTSTRTGRIRRASAWPVFHPRLGPHIGLNVHDPASTAAPLAPGMVVTIEPGIYIPEENLGVRIEDDVLITPTGYKC